MQANPGGYKFSGLVAMLGLLALLIGFIVMLLLPSIRYTAWGILVLGILLLATAFIIDFRRVSRAITGQRGMFGVSTTVMASIFIGIILFINAISIGNYHRFDVTGVAQFTLTPQTKEVLSKLEAPVEALFFYSGRSENDVLLRNHADNLLNEYQNYTDQLSVEFIDPDEYPDRAREYEITQYSTAVFKSQNRRRLVSPQEIAERAEHAFTSAILEVTGIVQKKVYFLTGHGESSINSNYSYARDGLLDNLYKVAILNLLVTPSIPEDATALIIAAPQRSLTSGEVDIIERYLENGGWLMILTNPESPPEIKQLLSAWGIEIEDGTVIDPSSYLDPNKDMPLVTWPRNFVGLPEIYFPGATAIIPQEEVLYTIIIKEPLVWTSQESWLERDFDPTEEPEFDEGIDRRGPLALGVLIVATPTEGANGEPSEESRLTRLVVIGDSDFASNQHFYNGNNGDFFLNSVEFLTAGTELVSIEHKVLPFRRLIVGPEAARFINYSSIGLLPLLVLVIGVVIWWRRR